MKKIKYRTCEYIDSYAQEFNSIVPEFAYNSKKKCLEKVGEIDLQEKLNSYKDICLNSILRRFLEPTIEIKDTFDPRRSNIDLAQMGEVIETANHFREKYNLNDTIYENPVKVFEYLKMLSQDNAKSLDKKLNEKVGEINGKTKENFNEKIEKDFSKNSKQDSQEES